MISKVTIELELSDEEDHLKLRRMLSVDRVYEAMDSVTDEVFRPARKHGYSEARLSKFFDEKTVPIEEINRRIELVGALEDLFFECLKDNDVSL